MELKSFRDILLKKSEGNPYLQTLIKYAKEELLAEEVIESLLKMAEPSAAMGRGANSALTSFAGQMDNTDVAQMRDALGHHISHYRGALKAHHGATDPAAKAKLRGVADQHLNQIVPLMHLAGRAGKHSGGKMTLDYVGTTPWESNYTTTDRHSHNGKLKEGTKDLGRRASPKANREKNPRAVPDYRYLEMAPHGQHPSSAKSPHKGGYPFEDIQLGSPEARDTGKAYLHLEDVDNKSDYTPHPFDKHPIHAVADHPEHHLNPEQKEKFINDLASWKSGEHHKNWLAGQKAAFQKDPEAYKGRGSTKAGHHFEGLPLGEQPAEARAGAAPAEAVSEVASEQTKPNKPTATASAQVDMGKAPVTGQAEFDKYLSDSWGQMPDKVKEQILSTLRKK